MKSIQLAIAAAAVVLGLGLTTRAEADSFTLSSYSVNFFNETPGDLGLDLNLTNPLGTPYMFSLTNPGDTHVAQLFTIGTGEGSVELDDLGPRPIGVTYSFTAPAFGGVDIGTSVGYYVPLTSCGFIFGGCGAVTWGAPIQLAYGTTGLLSIILTDVTFGTPGTAPVYATFRLDQNDTAPVPEPASLLLLGSGLVGVAARARRRLRTA